MWEQDGIILFCKHCETCRSVSGRFGCFIAQVHEVTSRFGIAQQFCFVATETEAPLCLFFFFGPSQHCFSPTGGSAEGDADQLPVSGGGFYFLHGAELIKGADGEVMGAGWKWKELARDGGQEPRQEEGIPPPSRLMRSELREHPCFPFFSFFKPAWERR